MGNLKYVINEVFVLNLKVTIEHMINKFSLDVMICVLTSEMCNNLYYKKNIMSYY